MIRVRRSSIRPLKTRLNDLACFLSVSIGNRAPTSGWAVVPSPGTYHGLSLAAERAAALATEISASSVYDFWAQLRDGLWDWAQQREDSITSARFGLALVERALIDACCRDRGIPFARALQDNAFRIDLGDIYKPLAGRMPRELLPPPANELLLHRVLADESNDAAAIEAGCRAYHLNLAGEPGRDFGRLKSLAARLDCLARYTISLSGGFGFSEPTALRELWEALSADPATKRLACAVTYISQPFRSHQSMNNDVVALFAEWPQRPPMLVDFEMAANGGLPRALEWGYAGSVNRASGGVIPMVADACLLGARMEREPVGKWTFAAALSPGLAPALPAELAIYGALGIASVQAPAACFAPQSEALPELWRSVLASDCAEIFNDDLSLRNDSGVAKLDAVNAAPLGAASLLEAAALAP